MSEHHDFSADVETVAALFLGDARPTEEQKFAAARVVKAVFSDLHSVADSLRRIADAQEQRVAHSHGLGGNGGAAGTGRDR